MAKTETGWTTTAPNVNGMYWWRAGEEDYEPEMHEIADDKVYRMESRRSEPVENYGGEWLGPISPADFEQLTRLREAATASQKLVDAVFYALKEGCFFPVPEPQQGATVQELVKWGAMRHLHDAIAEYNREKQREESEALTHRRTGE